MFYLGAMLLGLLAAGFVLFPLFRRPPVDDAPAREKVNLEVYRASLDEFAEVEVEEQAPLKVEAQKALLADTATEIAAPSQRERSRNWFIGAALVLPLLGFVIYHDLGFGQGAMPDVQLTQLLRETDPADRAAYRQFAFEVEQRANQKPGDEDIQFLLARVYSTLGEYDEAAAVYRGLTERFPEDADLLARYAEVLYVSADRQMTATVRQAIDAALALNPDELTMLEISGIAALQAGEAEQAVSWFEQALATGVTGRRAELIRIAISRITGDTPVAGRRIEIDVMLDSSIVPEAGAAVFVYARAAEGPPAPLAVQRHPVTALPMSLILDETMAMVQGMSLANFDNVIVIARLSQSGEVIPQAGDFEARSDVLDLTGEVPRVELNISERVQ